MITLEQYVGVHSCCEDWNQERIDNAGELLAACAPLYDEMTAVGVVFHINPATGSQVSGQTFGGFRPQDCPQGAPNSSHKEGSAVDWYDPYGLIDDWLMKHEDRLAAHGLYIEHPQATTHWSHWTTRAPRSGRRVFYP